MIISEQYIIEIKAKLFSSTVIQSVTIIRERILSDSGYFRARLILSNGDFLEIVEYFIVQNNSCITVTYRYQWMDGIRENLRKRWDNVEHFPDLPNFPHHVHIGAELNVLPSISMTIIEVIDQIALEINNISDLS